MGFVVRWAAAFVLIAATFNPTDWNFVRWAAASWPADLPMIALGGLILFAAYVVFLTATLRSIGTFGMALVLALVAAILWVLYDRGLLSLANPGLNTWIGIVALSLVLAIGLYWSILWRRISGQLEVDDGEG